MRAFALAAVLATTLGAAAPAVPQEAPADAPKVPPLRILHFECHNGMVEDIKIAVTESGVFRMQWDNQKLCGTPV